MRLIFPCIAVLSLVWRTQGYTIDDRDSVIVYSGSRPWEYFSSSDYYAGTTTDNACTGDQGCGLRFTFTGSGFSIYRWPIQNYDIPLRASVTVDGRSVGTIERSARNQDYLIYTLDSLTYGSHTAQIDLLSYTGAGGAASHLRLDKIEINETRPPVTATSPPTTVTTSSTVTSPPFITSNSSGNPISTINANEKKTPVGAIAGGVVGGVVVIFLLVAWLLYRAQQKKRMALDAEGQAPLAEAPRGLEGLSPEPLTYSGYPQPMYHQSPPQPSFMPAAFFASRSPNSDPRVVSSVTQDSAWSQFSDASPTGAAFVGASAVPVSPAASTPVESAKTPAASTLGSAQQTLSEEQVDFVAGLYRQGVPAPEVARIVERMLSAERSGVGEGSSTGDMAPAAAPPEYDFKSAV